MLFKYISLFSHKALLFFIFSSIFISCRKETCVSCISENPQGIIVEYESACDKSHDYIEGWEKGFRQKQEIENGNNVNCTYN